MLIAGVGRSKSSMVSSSSRLFRSRVRFRLAGHWVSTPAAKSTRGAKRRRLGRRAPWRSLYFSNWISPRRSPQGLQEGGLQFFLEVFYFFGPE